MKLAVATYVGDGTDELPIKGELVVPAFPFDRGLNQFIGLTSFRFCPRATVTKDVFTQIDVEEVCDAVSAYYTGIPKKTIRGIINDYVKILDKVVDNDIRLSGTTDVICVVNTNTRDVVGKIEIIL